MFLQASKSYWSHLSRKECICEIVNDTMIAIFVIYIILNVINCLIIIIIIIIIITHDQSSYMTIWEWPTKKLKFKKLLSLLIYDSSLSSQANCATTGSYWFQLFGFHWEIVRNLLRNFAFSFLFHFMYVVVNFLSQLIFIFPLFLGMIMNANEFETKEI